MDRFWENKKIIAYIALAHHTRFITPVMEQLAIQGADIKYIVGQAERSQEISAIELGLNYSHIYDYITEDDSKEIQKNYDLIKSCFSGSLKTNYLFGLMPLTVIDKTIYATAVEYIGIRNLLRKERPDLCFALHELNRWGKMFAFWAKKESVPFITLQEGLGYGLAFGASGHAQYSSLNLVWGERVKKKMVSFEAPDSKILPVGNTHLAKEITFQKENRIRETKRKEFGISDKFVTLLIISSIIPKPDLFIPICKMVSENNSQTLFIKFHPACKKLQIDKWVASITAQFKNNIYFIHAEENTYDLMSMADVCVLSERSTTGLESTAFGKPVIKLDFAYTPNAFYSFVDQGVAVKMSADDFAAALLEKTDFSKLIDADKKELFLKNELSGTTHSIEKVCQIFKKSIQANTSITHLKDDPVQTPDKKWSIIIQVPDNHDMLIAQLEAIAFNSEDQGTYEVLLVEPEKKSIGLERVIESLEGNIERIIIPENTNPIEMINKAGEKAKGENLIFLEKNLAPLKGWLGCLNTAFLKYGPDTLFGARISNKNGIIETAGIVVDQNNTPVSAYQYLNMDFACALKERSFQMVDHFVAMKRNLFFTTGGFTPDAGIYSVLDICLKARQLTDNPNDVVYLPDLKMIFLDHVTPKYNADNSVYFYGRWNGCLWESEKQLHKVDMVSLEALTQAKMKAALHTSR